MKSRSICKRIFRPAVLVAAILACVAADEAQTSSFTYQGRLTDGGTSANGNYDLQFALFDGLSGGAQVGSTQTLNTVAVSNGVFTVSLDFGASAFNGASRFLEISARPSSGGSFTLLSPRQQITSTPYAVRSLNATTADTVTVNGTSAFSVTGVGSFVNSNTFAGVGAGAATTPVFNGEGSDNSFFGNRAGERNTTGFNNSFFGESAGFNNTTASNNSFFGKGAGQVNSTGNENSFFGFNAGNANTTGTTNSFFGSRAGALSTTGFQNSFFGFQTGFKNTDGSDNAFFGSFSGQVNTTGSSNSIFGGQAGFANMTGSRNSFFGFQAGSSNTSGDRNTLIGFRADVLTGPLVVVENATAIGARARVDQSNALVLGSINGINGATADTNVGIGTTGPTARLSVIATGPGARILYLGTERPWVFQQKGTGAATALELTGDDPANNNKNFIINTNGSVGIGPVEPDQKLTVLGNASKSSGGTSWSVFSDERLKNIKGSFTPGLKALLQLQPIRFQYRPDNALKLPSGNDEVGFSAQAVERVLPEAVSRSRDGFLQLHSDPILWTMLNAIKEQQAQIQQQQKLIERQQALAVRQQQQLNALKKLACRWHRRAGVCQ